MVYDIYKKETTPIPGIVVEVPWTMPERLHYTSMQIDRMASGMMWIMQQLLLVGYDNATPM